MAKVIDKPTTIKRPTKTPDEYNDLVLLQRIVVNANRIGDLEYAEMAQARINYLNSGMRKELRTEFKRIISFSDDFPSDVVELAQRRIDRENRIQDQGGLS